MTEDERMLHEVRQLLREQNALLQRVHRIAVDDDLSPDTRLSAIRRWTHPWGRAKEDTT